MSERACGVRLHPAARLLRWMGRHAVGVCFLLIGAWLFRAVLAGADGISYDWQWYRVWRYLGRWTDGHFIPGPLLDGLGMTVRIALFGLALAVAVIQMQQSHLFHTVLLIRSVPFYPITPGGRTQRFRKNFLLTDTDFL